MQGEGPSPVQLHLGDDMVDMPSQQLIHQHASLIHVTCKPRILPQGQLPLCLFPCSAPGCRLQATLASAHVHLDTHQDAGHVNWVHVRLSHEAVPARPSGDMSRHCSQSDSA